jgi:hypothetical protein
LLFLRYAFPFEGIASKAAFSKRALLHRIRVPLADGQQHNVRIRAFASVFLIHVWTLFAWARGGLRLLQFRQFHWVYSRRLRNRKPPYFLLNIEVTHWVSLVRLVSLPHKSHYFWSRYYQPSLLDELAITNFLCLLTVWFLHSKNVFGAR